MNLIHFGLMVLSWTPAVATFLLGYQTMRAGFAVLGKPTIQPALFYLAKVLVAVLLALLAIASTFPAKLSGFPLLIQTEVPAVQQMMAMVFMLAGNLLLLPAYYTMSIFTRVGLPESEHVLQTEGIYRISRNPMYTSFLFFFPACFMLLPSLLVAVAAIADLVLHHVIILNEEIYLQKTFGKPYSDYKSRVARYL